MGSEKVSGTRNPVRDDSIFSRLDTVIGHRFGGIPKEAVEQNQDPAQQDRSKTRTVFVIRKEKDSHLFLTDGQQMQGTELLK